MKRPRVDWLRIGWLATVTLTGCFILAMIGVSGLVNHGDTGFPLNAVQRFIDGIWAWNPRLNFGVPQYLAHSTLPFDAVRTLPALLGIPVVYQSQLYFVLTFLVVALASERFATVGLRLTHPLARLTVATILVFTPFNVNQLLGGQGVQLIQAAALLATVTAFLEFVRTGSYRQLAWYLCWSLFVGSVFFPFLAILILVVVTNQPVRIWPKLLLFSLGAVLVNCFWIVPIVARTLTAPIVQEIFQSGTDTSVLAATKPFTGIDWVIRIAYGHYPVITSYVTFLKSELGILIGVIPSTLALLLLPQSLRSSRRRYVVPFLVLWLVSIALATGVHYAELSPIYTWLFDHVPLFQAYRVPAKFLLLVMIGLSAVLGIGLDSWLMARSGRQSLTRFGWTIGLVGLMAIMVTGGWIFGRSIAKEISLAHYPDAYFASNAPAGRWLELLPAATKGGYVPTQNLPTNVVRAYTPGLEGFDVAVTQAVHTKNIAPFFAARGLNGWLLHGDISMDDSLSQTVGRATTALEFRPAVTGMAPEVSVVETAVVTNRSVPENSLLANQPNVPFITVTDPPDDSNDYETIWQLVNDEIVGASPLSLPSTTLKGTFRLVGSITSRPVVPTVHIGTASVTATIDTTKRQFVSEPFTLTGSDVLKLEVPSQTVAPVLTTPVTFQTLQFTPAGPVELSQSTADQVSLSCSQTSLAGTTTIRNLDLDTIYRFSYTATTTGSVPAHAALEWLDATGQSVSVTQATPTIDIRPKTTTVRIYFYCEPVVGEGSATYQSIRFGAQTGLGVSAVYLVSSSYPALAAQEQTVSFTHPSRVEYDVSNAPATGTLILRMSADPWWEAVDDHGEALPRIGKAYGLFPAWELNGSSHIRIIFVGQRYFLWGVAVSLLTCVGLLITIAMRSRREK